MKHLLVLLFLALSFTPLQARAADTPLPVVTSFSILADMVKTIGGDAVTVTNLVAPDGDAHTFEPRPTDAKAVAAAKLVFVNGLGFEGWMNRLTESAHYTGPVIVVSKGVTPRTMTEDEDGTSKTVTDPHAWQNLENGRIYVKNISEALIAALPAQAQAIATRTKNYDSEIVKMQGWINAEFAPIPQKKRKIITSHDAFGYFGAAYKIVFLAPEGLSTESEPTAKDVAALIDQIKAQHVTSVFLENMSNPRLIKQIAKDGGARIGGTLYSDSLSKPDGPAATYLGMFKNNVPLLAAAMKDK